MRTPEDSELIRRAKTRLMIVHGADEPTAYHMLRYAAMDTREPMAAVARRVLERGTRFLKKPETPPA